MSSPSILILGAGFMQIPAMRTARSLGYRVIVADGNPGAPARHEADIFEHVDLVDKDAMLSMARTYGSDLAAVFTAGTDFSATVAWVSNALGLPGHGYEAALNASIKSRMRRIFASEGIPSPRFVPLGPQDGPEMAKDLQLPLVVKPVDNMGARGVSKVQSWDELPKAIALARNFTRSMQVIVEEFIEGPEYSIDSLVYKGQVIPRGLARRHIYFPPYFVELGHTLPSDLEPTQVKDLVETFSRAVIALGLDHGVAKGDVFMTARGPMIGEIAARLSGGYMSGWTYPLASGVDLTREAMLLALGRDLEPASEQRSWTSVERAIVSIPGVVRGISGIHEASLIGGVDQVVTRCGLGSVVTFPTNNVEKAGNIILARPTAQEAVQNASLALQSITITLEPNVQTTNNWLSSKDSIIPCAYPRLFSKVPNLPPSDWSTLLEGQKDGLGPLPILGFDTRDEFATLAKETCPWDHRTLEGAMEFLIQKGLVVMSNKGLGRCFWQVLARGGVQGVQYFSESFALGESTFLKYWETWESS